MSYKVSVLIGCLDKMERVVTSGKGDTCQSATLTLILDTQGSSFNKGRSGFLLPHGL